MYWGKNRERVKAIAVIGVLGILWGSSVAYADVANPLPVSEPLIYFAQSELLEDAFLTVAIEVPLFYLLGYRRLRDCIYFAGVNIVTNLLLNEFLQSIMDDTWYLFLLLLGECMVIALEFALCIYGIPTKGKKLFLTILLTNLASFLAGIVYYFFL